MRVKHVCFPSVNEMGHTTNTAPPVAISIICDVAISSLFLETGSDLAGSQHPSPRSVQDSGLILQGRDLQGLSNGTEQASSRASPD